MAKKHDSKNKKFALAVVVLIAVALLFLSGCAAIVIPNQSGAGDDACRCRRRHRHLAEDTDAMRRVCFGEFERPCDTILQNPVRADDMMDKTGQVS